MHTIWIIVFIASTFLCYGGALGKKDQAKQINDKINSVIANFISSFKEKKPLLLLKKLSLFSLIMFIMSLFALFIIGLFKIDSSFMSTFALNIFTYFGILTAILFWVLFHKEIYKTFFSFFALPIVTPFLLLFVDVYTSSDIVSHLYHNFFIDINIFFHIKPALSQFYQSLELSLAFFILMLFYYLLFWLLSFPVAAALWIILFLSVKIAKFIDDIFGERSSLLIFIILSIISAIMMSN